MLGATLFVVGGTFLVGDHDRCSRLGRKGGSSLWYTVFVTKHVPQSERYQAVYKQYTAVERIFSQAVALGIERPKLRNRLAIANQNTLTYILINLRAMQRLAETPAK